MEIQLFHDEGPYHVETSLLICRVNQWTGFYITETPSSRSSRKYLKYFLSVSFFIVVVCVSELGTWGVALDYVYREKLFVKQNSAL